MLRLLLNKHSEIKKSESHLSSFACSHLSGVIKATSINRGRCSHLSVEILTAQEQPCTSSRKYIAYQVSCSLPSNGTPSHALKWHVWQRYNAFHALRLRLIQVNSYIAEIEFPFPHWQFRRLFGFGTAKEIKEERKRLLGKWLGLAARSCESAKEASLLDSFLLDPVREEVRQSEIRTAERKRERRAQVQADEARRREVEKSRQQRITEEIAQKIDLFIRSRRRFNSSQPLEYACDIVTIERECHPEAHTVIAVYNGTKFSVASNCMAVRVRCLTPFQGEDTHRVFGYFRCGCNNKWHSAATWKDKWQKCKKCEKGVQAMFSQFLLCNGVYTITSCTKRCWELLTLDLWWRLESAILLSVLLCH